MALKRKYTKAEIKSAIDLAEGHRFSSYISVWGGNDSHFQDVDIINTKTNVKVKTITKYSPPANEAEKVSDDTGHTLRNHVKGHQEASYVGQKSRYDSLEDCLQATAEALNSDKGQTALEEMDADAAIRDRKLRVDVTGAWYGDAADGVKKKIKDVTVIVMRLGQETLWIHTSYPTGFVS
ncbi:MAG TPA: hypothetical protein VG146_06340 [Verrucomicrobiae bacterium]|nr:hypothetical protein [Verrucomicrobiae bacterium]